MRSLEFYEQLAADDSDDSDYDLLNQAPVFPSRKKPKQHEADSPTSVVSLSQSSFESILAIPSELAGTDKPASTEEEIEAKAQEMINNLSYPSLGDANSLDQLGWHKAPKQKKQKEHTWYPCRLCHPDEGIGLFLESPPGRTLVRYLGYQSDTAGDYDKIKSKEYFPLTATNRENGMQTYVKHLEKHFKEDKVACRAEELAVRAIWKIVEEREKSSSHAKSTAKKASKTTSPKASFSTSKKASSKRTLSSDCDNSSDEDSSDNDAEMKDEEKPTKKSLRAGDVIEYYNPIGVAGNVEWLKRAVILGVDAMDKRFPLNLDSGDFLDRSALIKRVKRRLRGKWEACKYAAFKEIRQYGLSTSGTNEMLAMKATAEKWKRIQKEGKEEIEAFWTKDSQKSNDHTWKIHLLGLLEHTRKDLATKRRFTPSMQPEQLEVLLRIWECLQQKIDSSNNSELNTKTIVPLLASKLKLLPLRLDRVMHGDEKKKLTSADKMEVVEVLQRWLEDPNLDVPEAGTRPAQKVARMKAADRLSKTERRRRSSRPLSQRNQNTCNK